MEREIILIIARVDMGSGRQSTSTPTTSVVGPAGSSRYWRVGLTWAPGPFGVWVANRTAINSLPLGAQEEACTVNNVICGNENKSCGRGNNRKADGPGYLKNRAI